MPPLRWRSMTAADLLDVQTIADAVHTSYPERPAIFAERLRLHASGCFVLADQTGRVVGYAISHPWDGAPPALDTLLQALPPVPSTLYIHDVALLPMARGQSAVADLMARIADRARRERLPNLSLIAVGGTAPVWFRHGFRAQDEPAFAAKLASYGDGAVFMRRSI